MQGILPVLASFFIAAGPAEEAAKDSQIEETPTQQVEATEAATPAPEQKDFHGFAGEITRNRVRLRNEPHLGSHIVKELNQGDLLVIAGETDEFYSVKVDPSQKAYIFRTYVLDGIVEGTRVNVRMAPDLDSPVIAQLNTGDKVNGNVCEEHEKWLEIDAPDSVRFYVAKPYVKNIGEAKLVAEARQRAEDVDRILQEAIAEGQAQLKLPFEEIDIDNVMAQFSTIEKDYSDFEEHVSEAQEAASLVQDAYLEKKIAFLEAKASQASDSWQHDSAALNEVVREYQDRLANLESKVKGVDVAQESSEIRSPRPTEVYAASPWTPAEETQYLAWKEGRENGSIDEFYQEQSLEAEVLSGTIEPYDKPIKNRPGDYILYSERDQRPVAYLYSTKVNLSGAVGKKVTLRGVERPNNHFAFPAYHVLSVE